MPPQSDLNTAAHRGAYPPLRALMANVASGATTPSTWVRVAVLDAVGAEHHGIRYELADPDLERAGGSLWATLTGHGLDSMSQTFGTRLPWGEMVGHTLDLRLASSPLTDDGRDLEIIDIEGRWVKRETAAIRRSSLRTLALLDLLDRQKRMHPDSIRRIEVLIERTGSNIAQTRQRLSAIESQGVAVRIREVDLRTDGAANAARLLRDAACLNERPDLIAIFVDQSHDMALPLLESLAPAAAICECGIPTVIGAPTAPHGSLLYDVAFAAANPAEALDIVEDLVTASLAAATLERRLRSYFEREDARSREQ